MTELKNRHSSSFRDPSGYIYEKEGVLYRHVSPLYFKQYEALKTSGTYKKMFEAGLLIPHKELSSNGESILLKPVQIPFFSYPYEWSFNQFKHAALHTLKLQKFSLQHGFSLKDATAFNITFFKGTPVFVDTLSFDFYEEGMPWRAYKQFLMHFFAPLVLAKYFGNDMLKLHLQYIDGIPLEKAVKLLPFAAKLNPVIYTNLFLTAKYESKYSTDKPADKKVSISKSAQLKIVDSLYSFIKGLTLNEKTEWKDYYQITNYEADAFTFKKKLVKDWFLKCNASKAIDLGGNDGTFARELKGVATEVLVTDIDPNAVDQNYIQVLKNKEQNILPLVSDLLNPVPFVGFNNKERTSLLSRIKKNEYDVTFALALIHHISLSGNVPFGMSAAFFASLTPYLVIEFPDRQDSWVTFLLNSKREFLNHFDYYNKENFEKEYTCLFEVIEKEEIPNSHRTMYLLKRKM